MASLNYAPHAAAPRSAHRRGVDARRGESTGLRSLRLGPVDDALEREAHAISEQVVRGERADLPRASAPVQSVQRACDTCAAQSGTCAACEDEVDTVQRAPDDRAASAIAPAAAATIRGFAGRGAALDAGLQSSFGSRFGFDFSRVRVHHDASAAGAARSLGARAFTVGPHIAFAAGQFAPGTARGNALLAHELVHVVQQRAASPSFATVQRAPDAGSQTLPAEKTSETLEAAYRRRGDTRRADAIRSCRTERLCGTVITHAQLLALYRLGRESGGDEAKIKLGLAGPAFVGLGFVSAGAETAVTGAAAGAGAATGAGVATGGGAAAGGGAAVGGAVIAGVAIFALVAILAAISLYEAYQVSKLQTELEDLGYTVLDEPLGVCIGGCHTSPAPRAPTFERFPRLDRFPKFPRPEDAEMIRRWLEQTPAPHAGPTTTPVPERDAQPERTGPDTAPPKTEQKKRTCATEYPGMRSCDSLPAGYDLSGITAALGALKAQTGDKKLRLEKTETTTSGPCPGQGTHTKVRSDGAYVATIVCCPCCKDTPGGPVTLTRCRIV